MTRIDYFDNSDAPAVNSLVPAATAVITNKKGHILLIRRKDNNLWALPGGAMEIGENIKETIIREVKEETGFDIAITRLVGIYTSPRHIIAFSDGEVRQEFSICFAGKVIGGKLQTDEESFEARFFTTKEAKNQPMSDSTRLRIDNYLARRSQPHIY